LRKSGHQNVLESTKMSYIPRQFSFNDTPRMLCQTNSVKTTMLYQIDFFPFTFRDSKAKLGRAVEYIQMCNVRIKPRTPQYVENLAILLLSIDVDIIC